MSVPTRRFGRTEVQMPVLTCGGMRYQQGWDDLDPEKIEKAGQENLEATIYYALENGINHIETARGYGPSEMQLGWVLPKIERDKLLVQTKIGVKDSAEEFLEAFENIHEISSTRACGFSFDSWHQSAGTHRSMCAQRRMS